MLYPRKTSQQYQPRVTDGQTDTPPIAMLRSNIAEPKLQQKPAHRVMPCSTQYKLDVIDDDDASDYNVIG